MSTAQFAPERRASPARGMVLPRWRQGSSAKAIGNSLGYPVCVLPEARPRGDRPRPASDGILNLPVRIVLISSINVHSVGDAVRAGRFVHFPKTLSFRRNPI